MTKARVAVDPAAIEDEFTRIWRETSERGADETATVRLRSLNFVALADHERDTARFEEIMQVLPQRHPCRGVLALTVSGRAALDAAISVHCWRSPGGDRHVCSEEVTLLGGAHQERELASAVLALLVPEIPVAVWLVGGVERPGYLAQAVLHAADRVLYDSGTSGDAVAAFGAALAVKREYELTLSDLAWGRLTTWRMLAAQLFDDEDGPRELATIRSIEVRGGAGRMSGEPMLLGAWLVSRLGLAIADIESADDALDATLYDGTRGVRLRIGPASAPGAPVEEVRIRTDDAEFLLQCHAASGHMHVRETWDTGSSRRAVDQIPTDDAAVIALALDGTQDARVYEETLQAALALLGG